MTISDDLFRAVLATDSYNRGTNVKGGGRDDLLSDGLEFSILAPKGRRFRFEVVHAKCKEPNVNDSL
jgi:hypothetical protein